MVGCLQGKTISGYAALVKEPLTMPPGGLVWFIPMKKRGGGHARNRTGIEGFAVLCVTTPPSGRGAQMLRFCHGVNRASRFSHADRHGETSIAFAATRRVGARFSRPAPHERVHNPERWRHSGLLWSACFRLAGLAVSSRSGLAVAKGCVAFQSQYQRQVHWLHLLC